MTTTPLTDQQLAADDHSPDWTAVQSAENLLAQRGELAILDTLQRLDEQNDARGREITRLAAELDQLGVRSAEERAVNDHLVGKLQANLTASDEWMDERATLLADNHKLAAELGRVRAELAAARNAALTDAADWLADHGEKDAAYLLRTCDIDSAASSAV